MTNLFVYAGSLHRFVLHPKGYIEIESFSYDCSIERFSNVNEKSLIISTNFITTKFDLLETFRMSKCLIFILNLFTTDDSRILFVQFETKPWRTKILQTFAVPSTIDGRMKFLSTNESTSLFITDRSIGKGFYRIDYRQTTTKNIEFIQCPLISYLFCYLKDEFFWLIGNEIETNSKRKSIQIYFHCRRFPTKNLIQFDSTELIPSSFNENIENLHLIEQKILLKSRSIVGEILIVTNDHRLVFCRRGRILQEISFQNSIDRIFLFENLDAEKFFLFFNENLRRTEIFQCESTKLTPHVNSIETAEAIFIDDFIQNGSKQILFVKNLRDFDTFLLTDFSQIEIDQNDFRTDDQLVAMEKNDDIDIQESVAFVRDILREKIIEADFLVTQGQYQCRQIRDEIRRISNQHRIPNLNSQLRTSTCLPMNEIELLEKNWFIYREILYIFVTVKNTKTTLIKSLFLLAVDQHGNELKDFQLTSTDRSISNLKGNFQILPENSLTLTLTTNLQFDRDIRFDLCLIENEMKKCFPLGSIDVTMDELIDRKTNRILKLDDSSQFSIYFSTFPRLEILIRTNSKFELIADFHRLLTKIGFESIQFVSDGFLRIDDGNLFGHVFIHLANTDEMISDDLIVHFYAQKIERAATLCRYILSKIDFQSFSLILSNTNDDQSELTEKIRAELDGYVDVLKSVPTVMRKVNPTAKSESYRLFKMENFQQFEKERRQTDLVIGSTIID